MKTNISLKCGALCAVVLCSSSAFAEAFEFDRPGQALGTGIVPKGHVAWEQGLPTVSYDESRVNGVKQSDLTLQADALLRIGVGSDTELRIGWDGPIWQRHKVANVDDDIDGVGDIQIGVKKAIDLGDDQFAWALLAQVNLATGDDEFTQDEEIYTLGSTISYKLSPSVNTGITMLYDYQDKDLSMTAIPNISYQMTDKLNGFAEYVFKKTEHQKYQSVVNTGLTYNLTDNIQLDASIGYSFNQQQPDYNGGLGVSFLF